MHSLSSFWQVILIFPVFPYFALFTGYDNWQKNEPIRQKIKKKKLTLGISWSLLFPSQVFFSFWGFNARQHKHCLSHFSHRFCRCISGHVFHKTRWPFSGVPFWCNPVSADLRTSAIIIQKKNVSLILLFFCFLMLT